MILRRLNPLLSLPIKHKLSLISIVPTAALLLASIAFVAYDYIAVRNSQIRSDERLADAIGARSMSDATARQMIATLDRNPDITRTYVFDADRNVIVRYIRPDVLDIAPPLPPREGPVLTWDHIGVYRPIKQNGQLIGSVYLESDRREQYPRLQRSGVVIFLLFVGSLLLGLAV